MAAQALVAGGAEVAAWDDKETSRAKATTTGVTLADLRSTDWSAFDAVLAPGVPLTSRAALSVLKAQAAGIPIIGDIELFCRERATRAPQSRLVAITGTNGKSTTTALTAHLFKSFGYETGMGEISARRCSNSIRPPRPASMSWNVHRTKSISRPA